MAQSMKTLLVPILLLMLMAIVEATPPGVAKSLSYARCSIKKYKYCYNLKLVCPKSCPHKCTVDCVSCKSICVSYKSPPPPQTPTHSPPSYSPPSPPTKTPTPPTASTPPPSPPTPTTTPPPSPPATTPTPPTTSTPPPSPPTSSPSPPPPAPTTPTPPTTSSPPPSIPSSPTPPSPSPPSPSPPPSTPSPTPPAATPPPSFPTPSPPTSSSPPPTPKTVKCKNMKYPECYNMEQVCPSSCPGGCEVDCVTCKPVCSCDRPGAVCQDPRFIGGDGITFYFHGKKDRDFCLLSDSNLHINAHFIGKRNQNMKRDFTWVQSIAIFFDKHQLFIGAQKTAEWEDSIDRLTLTFDNEPITLTEVEGATWQSTSSPSVFVNKLADTNSVMVEVEGSFRITAKVVPITKEDSRIHNYGITNEDSFAHLDLGFKFLSLSNEVSGVLGQTYRPDYVSRVNIGATMPVLGGDKNFETSSLFSTDCAVARFGGSDGEASLENLELPSLICASGIDGQGVICRK